MDGANPPAEARRLLVIDDEAMIAVYVKGVARREPSPIEVRSVQDGALGVAVAAEFQPGLILLDVRLPGMDGFEILARLKADARTRDIPVIFMTALDTLGIQRQIQESGAAGFIWKPPDINEIRRVLRAHLPEVNAT